jgi:hypothetical protein
MVSLQRGPASVGARDAEKNNAPFANRAGKETPDLFMFERFLLMFPVLRRARPRGEWVPKNAAPQPAPTRGRPFPGWDDGDASSGGN